MAKYLVIVESPAKVKTIKKFLGSNYEVAASNGHVRDLPKSTLGIDVENDYEPKYITIRGKGDVLANLRKEVKKAEKIYLATDPDREGEAISWHLYEALKLSDKKVYRITFNEITKTAVKNSLKEAREINMDLVDAQQTRRMLDRMVGYRISPVLWAKVKRGLSAGRVQSVAVKLVVDREKEIEDFKPVEYWSIDSVCTTESANFNATLNKFNGKKIEKMTIENKEFVDDILNQIGNPKIAACVVNIEKKKNQRKPAAPFTTSTLQQEAARKLYFASKRTMSAAQKLYEQGLITYMRTDATNLNADAVNEIRGFIAREYGDNFVPSAPNIYTTKSKNAQEAHEAIRPTHFDGPAKNLSGDEAKLYDLIWKRTIACQMTNAEFDSVAADIETDNHVAVFHAVGTTRTFDGFMKVKYLYFMQPGQPDYLMDL